MKSIIQEGWIPDYSGMTIEWGTLTQLFLLSRQRRIVDPKGH